MSYPCTRSQTKAAASSLAQPAMPSIPPKPPMPPVLASQPDSSQSDPPLRAGMPFKKMYELRSQVRKTMAELNQAEAHLVDALRALDFPRSKIDSLQSDVRFKSAEIVSLQKKLEPMEANFRKATSNAKGNNGPAILAPIEPPIRKKQKTKDDGKRRDVLAEAAPVVEGPMVNTATLEVALPPGGCPLTADECQFAHIERLRRQYAHPFALFCEEMDTISDSCLTGICLTLPDMPWSIAVSRLAFLFKSTLDSPGRSPKPSDTQYLSAGTTIGCEQHVRYIRLAELMVIQDWRDFMRWAHHQSHLFNLCGQRSCIKLKHMVLEPIDCMSSRLKCRIASDRLHKGARPRDSSTGRLTPLSTSTCNSPGCWPPCLHRYPTPNLLHSVMVEFAAFHQVSFGPVTSSLYKDLYAPISEHQLGKLVNNEDVGLIFPFRTSYGHIFVDKWEDDSFVQVDTMLSIPPTYTVENMEPILRKLPTWTNLSFNHMSSSLFWYARRRNSPLLAGESEKELGVNARFDSRLPQYQCPLCHGFDNHVDPAGPFKKILDFGDFTQALQHILSAHPRVPMSRKLQFLYEETLECPTICDAWKVILQEKYDDGIASLAKGGIHQAIADLCGYTTSVDRMPTAVSNGSSIYESEKHAEADVTKVMGCAEAQKFPDAGPSCHLKSLE